MNLQKELQKEKWLKCISFLFLVAAISIFMTISAKAENEPIQCGDHVYATLNSTGVLTVSGTGDMWNCASLQSYFRDIREKIYKVVIEDGVTSVGDWAFEGCDYLQDISFGKSVRRIGDNAFYDNDGLFSIKIPGNVQTIGKSAFSSSGLTTCILNEGLQTIGEYAFFNTNLTSIVIPEGITAIRERAFYSSEVKNVTIPGNIGVIENKAFDNVSATIYSNDVTIVSGAFGRNSVFTAKRGSTADKYAENYDIDITYFECVPNSGYPQLSHSWDGGICTVKPTCVSTGTWKYTCSRCGATRTESINKIDHVYGAWRTTTESTVLRQGEMTRSCTACGRKETKKLPKKTPTLSLNVKSLPMEKGRSTSKVKITNMGRGDKVASWKSSNSRIVKVSSKGRITAKNTGTAYIRVTLKSGISKKVKIVVKNTPVATSKLTVSCKNATLKNRRITLKKGKKCTLVTKVRPITSMQRVQYLSSNKKVVSVTRNGIVTAKKKGKAKVTVKSGKKKVVITLYVR